MTDTRPGMTDAERLEALIDELATRLTALPDATFTQRAGVDDWTAAEVVGHMVEMMPYWAQVATAVAREPGRHLGRALDDPDRIGAVASANDVPRAEALASLRHAAHDTAQAIRALDAAQWEVTGTHPIRGEMSVGQVIRELVVEHTAGHVRQALDAAGAGEVD